MTTFEELGTPEFILRALQKRGITDPTPIQKMAIPAALTGKDLFASAATGSGKTIAYLIPVIANLINDATKKALILAPTRELAQQINDEILKFSSHESPFRVALLIGGRPYFQQTMDLKKNSKIVVGTPGRVRDHLERGTLRLDTTTYFILDETDRMLDLGFSDDLAAIAKKLPQEKQTLMFSATLSPSIERVSKNWLIDPIRLAADVNMQTAKNIKEESVFIRRDEKFGTLLQALKDREGAVIVFVRTKIGAEDLARKLRDEEHLAEAIHGDLPQRKRDRVIKSFRSKRSRIMVATDVASRGLDIPHIMHVINFDLPECAEDYIHRVGRTGRAGKEGFALSFISPEEKKYWKAIKRLSGEDPGFEDDEAPRRGSRPGGAGAGRRRPFSKPSSGGSWKPKPRFGEGGSRDFTPRSGGRDFAPRGDGGSREFTPRSGGRDFAPRGDGGGRDFTPRGDGGSREFTPRSGGRDFAPRGDGGGREFTPRSGGRDFAPRGDGGGREFTPRTGGRDFTPRSEGGSRDFTPRSSGPRDFAPKKRRFGVNKVDN